MIEHVWSVLCSKSIMDSETNNISLDVFEELLVADFDLPPNMKGALVSVPVELVSLWYRVGDEASRGRARVTLFTPEGEETPASFNVDLEIPKKRLRSRTRMGVVPVSTSGTYIYRVELQQTGAAEWTTVARIPLEVVLNPPVAPA